MNSLPIRGRAAVLPVFSALFLLACSACLPAADTGGGLTGPAAAPPSPTVPAPTATVPPTATPSPLPPSPSPTLTATPQPTETPIPADAYLSQPGDTLAAIAAHFGVQPGDLQCVVEVEGCQTDEAAQLLAPGTPVLIADKEKDFLPGTRLVPDSEVVFSAAATDFNVTEYVDAAGGSLAAHRQYLMMNAWNTGADIVSLVAYENSVNPRLLLALLEYQCRCVQEEADSPEPFMGADFYNRHDLYGQLVWAVHELSEGYYGWRAGTLTDVTLTDGTVITLDPALNAGTVGLYELFSYLYGREGFFEAIDPHGGFAATYEMMFGDPWTREVPLYTSDTRQPELALPFEPGFVWSFTGGPHPAFEGNGPRAALDFAPASAEPGCQPTTAWVTAAADGVVVRSEYGMVVQDLDGDGNAQTGWTIVYLHVGQEARVPVGAVLKTGDRVGQPSCEGGTANGTHLHIARRLNGEWIAAGSGPMPFDMNGWIAQDAPELYKGTLSRGGTTLVACTCSWRQSWIEND